MPDRGIISSISNYYPIKILKAFKNNEQSVKSLEVIVNSLVEIYRYFEPSFFTGEFFVCKSFDDVDCFDPNTGVVLYDKNILLNKTAGIIIVQVSTDGKLILWENQNPQSLLTRHDTLTYLYKNNKEYFFAN